MQIIAETPMHAGRPTQADYVYVLDTPTPDRIKRSHSFAGTAAMHATSSTLSCPATPTNTTNTDLELSLVPVTLTRQMASATLDTPTSTNVAAFNRNEDSAHPQQRGLHDVFALAYNDRQEDEFFDDEHEDDDDDARYHSRVITVSSSDGIELVIPAARRGSDYDFDQLTEKDLAPVEFVPKRPKQAQAQPAPGVQQYATGQMLEPFASGSSVGGDTSEDENSQPPASQGYLHPCDDVRQMMFGGDDDVLLVSSVPSSPSASSSSNSDSDPDTELTVDDDSASDTQEVRIVVQGNWIELACNQSYFASLDLVHQPHKFN